MLETTQQQFSSLRLALDPQNQIIDPITNLPVDITEPGSGRRRKPTGPTGFQASLVGNYERNTVTLAGTHEEAGVRHPPQ